ncbi:MAG: tRNA uridine-5-carboxymethylaminomethyl(34) synthesis GTPase MnmE [Flavobacterium sp. BFFFF2]|nr:MAG: tRNA uridine-5-carboxymethylaminomethyl(34) synthesis GTPase MnmE [Flavobacterium sp. BFFFF2]
MISTDTIVALATAPGMGAIAVIRLSGPAALAVASQLFTSASGKILQNQPSHTVHLGFVSDGERIIDQVLATVFRNPHSYTGEDVVEWSCHGSTYIQQELLQLLLRNGLRLAEPGEFTLRAFLNGKIDLSQAEAVGDLIQASSASSHQVALQQMRGGMSNSLKDLRQQLLDFASLMELELDFSEEDVQFADRSQFLTLLSQIRQLLQRLSDSFAIGNAIKQGIPVAIIGAPNAGKSTLLNSLFNEERALVSEIAGTTRDSIEDTLYLKGLAYRFIDTAGIRETLDTVEQLGIERTFNKVQLASIVLYLVDVSQMNAQQLSTAKTEMNELKDRFPDKIWLLLANKSESITETDRQQVQQIWPDVLFISAKNRQGIDLLIDQLTNFVQWGTLGPDETVVSNSRHYGALMNALEAIDRVIEGMSVHLPTDLLTIDLHEVIDQIGSITGQVTHDEVLGNIFANFCIGK